MLNFEELQDGDGICAKEGGLLYGLVRALGPNICLEVGTHKGLSACYIASALKENGGGHLWTCDPVDYEAEENFRKFGFEKIVTYLKASGATVKLEDPIDFAFIDGAHEKEAILADFNNIRSQLSKNAVVVFHDAWYDVEDTDYWNGTERAIAEAGVSATFLRTHAGLAIYEHSQRLSHAKD